MWALIALVVATQTVLCEVVTPDQHKKCTRSVVIVKTHEYSKDITLIEDHRTAIQEINKAYEAKPQENPFPGEQIASDFKMTLETMAVQKGDAGGSIVKRLTGFNENGEVRATVEYSASNKGSNRYTVLTPGSFEDLQNSCTEKRMHKMYGSYGRYSKPSATPPTGTASNLKNQNTNVPNQQYGGPMPNNYPYQQNGNWGYNNYGMPYPNTYPNTYPGAYPNTMAQPNNMQWMNQGYGYPPFNPPAPHYGNYAPMQGNPSYNNDYYYGQTPQLPDKRPPYTPYQGNPKPAYDPQLRNQNLGKPGNPKPAYDPQIRNPNLGKPGANSENQRGYKPDQFTQNVENPRRKDKFANSNAPQSEEE
ncbi:hypothetical protein ANCCAN_06383 [Ancylostoma caninum]|uniref:Uncharacterized protein n=1 Tax=Ancylostoma caninum TaxID=29170 RepID=A0A368GSX3_ANCCA|nr:hypothetical protein ANCCAN_06383 [Ancylostoma caninum]